MIVGLTGGIGSGKSTVANFFKELGIPVYDSDAAAKALMVESEELKDKIIKLFGKDAYIDKRLNKTYISSIVFSEKEKLNQLNAIVHPEVRKHFMVWVTEQNAPYVIQETALIFENAVQKNYDVTILTTSPEPIRIQRIKFRDGLSEKQIKARMGNQLPDDIKKALADYTIENIELKATRKSVQTIHEILLDQVSQKSRI